MACACKVTQQIDYLHKKYGDDLPKSKKTNIRGKVIAGIRNTFIYILALPLVPVFLIYSLYTLASGKTIHIDKFIRKNVREQQNI